MSWDQPQRLVLQRGATMMRQEHRRMRSRNGETTKRNGAEKKLRSDFSFGVLLAASTLILGCTFPAASHAQGSACVPCHAGITQNKVVHAPAYGGCATCHSELDATAVPHKSKGKVAGGLSADVPALCTKCHERKLFEGKFVHAPVAGALCLTCHDPHASDQVGLLKKEPATLCLDCHPDIKKTPHVVAGISGKGHPLGDEAKWKEATDPLRPGKKFYCASCHEPHRSDQPKLTRYGSGMSSCQKCHKM